MSIVALVVKCNKCGFEIRSDWKFCPSCADTIVCTDKYGVLSASKKKTGRPKPKKE